MAAFGKGIQTYASFLYPTNSQNEGRINPYCQDAHRLYLLFRRDGAALGTNSYNPGPKK